MPSEKWKDLNVTITGGAGFLGSAIFDRLNQKNASLTVIDNLSTGSHANLPENRHGWRFISKDITRTDLPPLLAGTDVLIHTATAPLTATARIAHPAKYASTCLSSLLAVLDAARRLDIQSILLPGTHSIYPPKNKPWREDDLPDDISFTPDPSSWLPRIAEKLAISYAQEYGLAISLPRFSELYGPRMPINKSAPSTVGRELHRVITATDVLHIDSNAQRSLSLLYIDDAARACEQLALHPEKGTPINIGPDKPCTQLDLTRLLLDYSMKPLKIAKTKIELHKPNHPLMDTSRARKFLGFTPAITFRQGIEKTWLWVEENFA